MTTFAPPRALLRPTPAGRSLLTPSRLSSWPVVMVYGEADEATAVTLARIAAGSVMVVIPLKRWRTSWDAGPHSLSRFRLLAGSCSALSALFLRFDSV